MKRQTSLLLSLFLSIILFSWMSFVTTYAAPIKAGSTIYSGGGKPMAIKGEQPLATDIVWDSSLESAEPVMRNEQTAMKLLLGNVVANDDFYVTHEDVPLTVAASGALANDTNTGSGELSAVMLAPPAFGTVDLQPDGSFTYTPDENASGDDVFVYQAIAPEDPTEMIAYWKLDDNAPFADDSSGHGHLGMLVGGTGWIPDTAATTFANPSALFVDGLDGHVAIPDDDTLDFGPNDNFTVALWVRAESIQLATTTVDNSIVEKWSGVGGYPFVIRYLNQTGGADNGSIQVVRFDGTNVPYMNSNTKVNDGQFHHVAFVKNGPTLELYIDGVLDNSITDTTTADTTNNSPLFLGQRGDDTNQFTGVLDDVRIYGQALFPHEVERLAQGHSLIVESNPATVNITVNPVNDAPVAASDTYTTSQRHAITINAPGVLGNDSDIEGDAFTAALLTSPLSGDLNFQPDGSFIYTPVITFSGAVNFLYQAQDTINVVGYWPFNALTSPNPDMSGNGHDGTLVGGLSLGAGSPVSPISFDFDGIDDQVVIGGNETDFDLNVLSLALWVKVDAFTSSEQALVTKGNTSWRLQRYLSTGFITFSTNGLSNVDLVSNQTIDDGQWHHIVAVYDGNEKAIYIDGVLDNSVSVTGSLSQNNQPVVLGENAESTGRYFDGEMDEVYIYGEALSAADIPNVMSGFGQGMSSAPAEVEIQVFAPLTPTTLIPAAASHTAALNTSMTMNFNNPIIQASVNSQSWVSYASFNGRIAGAVAKSAAAITYDPSSDFFPGELVHNTLLTDVRDIIDAPMPHGYVWQFQTAAGAGPAQFTDSGNTSLPSGNTYGSVMGDVDQDGDLDVITINYYSIIVYHNNGSGTLTYSYSNGYYSRTDGGTGKLLLGDFDGDSDLDFLELVFGAPNRIWFNNGGVQGGTVGTFTLGGQTLGSYEFTTGGDVGDLDGDGDLDILTVSQSGHPHKVWLNNGVGTFTDNGQNLGTTSFTDVAVGDLDGDGDLDAYVTNYTSPNRVWLNDGRGNLIDSGQALGGTSYTTAVALGDVDNDGDLDAFVTNVDSYSSNKVWLNNGSGQFSDGGQKLSTGYVVALGDMDGDGDLDALTGDTNYNILWFNNGSGQFSNSGRGFSAYQSTEYAFGDIDADGDIDLFVPAFGAAKLWLNAESADLSLSKTVNTNSVNPGDTIIYTFTYANAGPNTAYGVQITDIIHPNIDPDSLSVVSSGAVITPQLNSSFVWDVADLAVGQGGVITITGVIIIPTAAGEFTDDAQISTTSLETLKGNNKSAVTIEVAEVSPVANDDTFNATEDTPLTVNKASGLLANDYDLNGDSLTVELDSAPSSGNLQLQADGSFVYTPSLNFNGIVTFSYQTAAAENPVHMGGYWPMDDNALTAADASGHNATGLPVDGGYYITTNAGYWTTNTAPTNFSNPYAYLLKGDDEFMILSYSTSLLFGGTEEFSLAFWVKADEQTDLTYNVNHIIGNFGPEKYGYQVYYLNQNNGASNGRIQVSRSDGSNTPLIESTVAINDNQFHHIAFVKNGSLLTLYIDGVPDGTVTDNTNMTTVNQYNPSIGGRYDQTRYFKGIMDEVRLYRRGLSAAEVARLSTGNMVDEFSQTAVVTITVNAVNDIPIAASDAYTIPQRTTLNVSAPGVLANDSDPEGGELTAVLDTDVAHGTLTLNSDGSFSYSAPLTYCGTDSFTYHADNGNTDSPSVTVTLNITCVAAVLNAENDTASTDEDTAINIAVLDNDTHDDEESLTITAVSAVNIGTISHNGTKILYIPVNRKAGYVATFSYTVKGGSLTASAAVTVNVSANNDAPTAVDNIYSVNENSSNLSLPVLANDSDVDSDDVISLLAVGTPDQGGTAEVSGNVILYSPSAGFAGIETMTYTIEDIGGLTAMAVVTISVDNENDQPIAIDNTYLILEDSGTHTLSVLDNDSDLDLGDTLSLVTVTTPNQGGTAVINGAAIQYTPVQNFVGVETFSYTIQDTGGLTATAQVTITVENVNDAPTAVDDTYTVDEDSTVQMLAVLANDTDIDDGDSLSLVSVSTPSAGGMAELDSNNVRYTPAENFVGVETIVYIIQDTEGLTSTAQVTITVENVNDAPTAVDDSYTVDENSQNNPFAVLANDSDIDAGDSLSITAVGTPSQGTAVISGNEILYTPHADFFGTDSFTYIVTDGVLTNQATVQVTILENEQTGTFYIFLPLIVRP